MRVICLQDSDTTRRENNISRLVRRVGKANGSRKCAPDDRLRVPTVRNAVGTARCAFAHPHMGPCESRLSNGSGLDFRGERAARGAVRSAARRPGPERGLASENCSSSLHHLISGRTLDPYPHSACLRRGSHEDETHLRTGLVWPLGGTVIIHPPGERGLRRGAPARVRFYAFMVAPSGTSPAVR
jgi:hypothetical protein